MSRPLSIKEKLAAARAGGTVQAPPPAERAESDQEAPTPPASAPTSGRPLTLKEKLAAARGVGDLPAPTVDREAVPPPSPTPARTLPPLDEITDPRDLAHALRHTGAEWGRRIPTAVEPPSNAASRPSGRHDEPTPSRGQPILAGVVVMALGFLGWLAIVGVIAVLAFLALWWMSPEPAARTSGDEPVRSVLHREPMDPNGRLVRG